MSVSSPPHSGPRHLCPSEEDEIGPVIMNKCRVDSGEDGSIGSARHSPKLASTAPVSRSESSPSQGSLKKKAAHQQQGQPVASQQHPKTAPKKSAEPSSPTGTSSSVHTSKATSPVQRAQPRGHPLDVPLDLATTPSHADCYTSSTTSSHLDATSPSSRATDSQTPQLLSPPHHHHHPQQQQQQRQQLPQPTKQQQPPPPPEKSVSGKEAAPGPAADPSLDDEPTCCICMEPYTEDNPMFRGQCKHHFHLPCLLSWKQRSNSCPMCCAETLRGIGDIEDDGPVMSPSQRQHEAVKRPDITDDEEYALMMQRRYLRRVKRKAEERKRNAAAAQYSSPQDSQFVVTRTVHMSSPFDFGPGDDGPVTMVVTRSVTSPSQQQQQQQQKQQQKQQQHQKQQQQQKQPHSPRADATTGAPSDNKASTSANGSDTHSHHKSGKSKGKGCVTM